MNEFPHYCTSQGCQTCGFIPIVGSYENVGADIFGYFKDVYPRIINNKKLYLNFNKRRKIKKKIKIFHKNGIFSIKTKFFL